MIPTPLNRWRWLASVIAILVSPSVIARAAEPRLPNVIIIMTDDQGYGDLGCSGATGFTTPNLDQMARDGRRFTNFHSAQAVCSASRAGILTGCYPNRIGIHGALGPNAKHGLSDQETTIAQVLKGKGYATCAVGKWHLGHLPPFLPTRHGFDEWLGLPYSNDMWPLHPEAKPGTYPPLPLYDGEKPVKVGLTHEDQSQLTTIYTERAVSFINKHHDGPFFLYLAHSMPHVPLHVSDKFKGKSEQGLYGDVIEEIDWSVSQVLGALKRYGIENDTLVIYTSDNGPWLSYGNHAGSAGPLREGKGTSWEGGNREPFLIRWPGHIPANTVSDDMAMAIDLLPTIAKLANAPLPAQKIDGLDIWPLLSGEPGTMKNPHDAYWIYYEQNQLQAVIDGQGEWKLQLPHTYRTLGGRPGGKDGIPVKYQQAKLEHAELYDLKNDRGEKFDVSTAHPEIVKQLQDEAEKARAELGDALTKQQGTGSRKPGLIAPGAPAKADPKGD